MSPTTYTHPDDKQGDHTRFGGGSATQDIILQFFTGSTLQHYLFTLRFLPYHTERIPEVAIWRSEGLKDDLYKWVMIRHYDEIPINYLQAIKDAEARRHTHDVNCPDECERQYP